MSLNLSNLSLSYLLPTLLALLPTAFGFVAVHVALFLQSDNWNKLINGVIALLVIVLATAANLLVAGKFTSNLTLDLRTFEVGFVALAFGGMRALLPWVSGLQGVIGFTSGGFLLFPKKATTSVVPAIQRASVVSNAVQSQFKAPVPPTADNGG